MTTSVYLDNILIFSHSLEEHLSHLMAAIQKLEEVVKCQFAQKELEYIGHVVSCDGLKTNPKLVAAIREFPCTQSVDDTRKFLGFTSYYRHFILNFSQIARSLYQLTCDGAEFLWSPEYESAFQELKVSQLHLYWHTRLS